MPSSYTLSRQPIADGADRAGPGTNGLCLGSVSPEKGATSLLRCSGCSLPPRPFRTPICSRRPACSGPCSTLRHEARQRRHATPPWPHWLDGAEAQQAAARFRHGQCEHRVVPCVDGLDAVAAALVAHGDGDGSPRRPASLNRARVSANGTSRASLHGDTTPRTLAESTMAMSRRNENGCGDARIRKWLVMSPLVRRLPYRAKARSVPRPRHGFRPLATVDSGAMMASARNMDHLIDGLPGESVDASTGGGVRLIRSRTRAHATAAASSSRATRKTRSPTREPSRPVTPSTPTIGKTSGWRSDNDWTSCSSFAERASGKSASSAINKALNRG